MSTFSSKFPTANTLIANHKAEASAHAADNISGFDTKVAANTAVSANTDKVTNATHTGDVTGSGELTIGSNKVTNAKLAQVATATIKGRATAGIGNAEDLTAAQARTILNVADGADVTGTAISSGAAITTIADADKIPVSVGGVLKTIAYSALKALLDALYGSASAVSANTTRRTWEAAENAIDTVTGGAISVDASLAYNQSVEITTTDASLLLSNVSNLSTYKSCRLEVHQNGGEIDDVTGWTVDDNFALADLAGATRVVLLMTYSNSTARLAIESIEA